MYTCKRKNQTLHTMHVQHKYAVKVRSIIIVGNIPLKVEPMWDSGMEGKDPEYFTFAKHPESITSSFRCDNFFNTLYRETGSVLKMDQIPMFGNIGRSVFFYIKQMII